MRQRKVDLSRQRVDDHDRLYEVVRSRWDDEQTRRLIWEQHTQSRFLAEFQAKMAAYGVTKLAPQQQQALNAILQKQDDTALALQQRIVSTPAKITRSGYVYPKESRELAMYRAKKGVDVEATLATESGKEAIAAPRMAAEREAKGGEEAAKQEAFNKRWLADYTKKARNLKGQIAAFEAQYSDDIPGLVWGTGFLPTPGSADEEAQMALELLEESTVSFLTGAHAPERTIERLTAKLRDAKAEGDVHAALRVIKQMADIEIDSGRRALETGELSSFEGTDPSLTPRPGPEVPGGGGMSSYRPD
jgi:hypothetical protein